MQGVVFVIDQLGLSIIAKDSQIAQQDAQIAQLTAENEQLKAQVAEPQQPTSQEGSP